MKNWLHRVIINISCSLVIAVASYLAFLLLAWAFPYMGYAGFIVLYGSILAGVIAFYYLTSEFLTVPTLISLVLGSVIWIWEMTPIVEWLNAFENNLGFFLVLPIGAIGAILIAVNKLIMDVVYLQVGLPLREARLNRILKSNKDYSQH